MDGRVDELEAVVDELEATVATLEAEYVATQARIQRLETALDLAAAPAVTGPIESNNDRLEQPVTTRSDGLRGATQAEVDRAVQNIEVADEDILEA